MIEKKHNHLYFNTQIKVCITLILMFALRTNFWISELLFSLGIPYLRFQKLWFLFIPATLILIKRYYNHKIQINNLFITSFFLFTHYFMETFLYGINYNPGDNIDLFHRWLYIYIIYIVLINLEPQYLSFTIKRSITLLIINLSIIYADLLGFVNVAQVAYGYDVFSGRLNSTQNLNIIADMSVFGIVLVYWLRYIKEPYKLFILKNNHIYLLFLFLPIIFLNASRGSLILLFSSIFIYSINKWFKVSMISKIIFFSIIISLFLLQNSITNYLLEQSFVFERLYSTPMSVESSSQGRIFQIVASWNNFLTSPIIGVGYNNAASGHFFNISRSNFQYTQILASGGVILFIIYFYMIYKFFAKSYNLISSSLIVRVILIFILILFIFRRPEFYFAIFGYIVYIQNLSLNEKYNNSR